MTATRHRGGGRGRGRGTPFRTTVAVLAIAASSAACAGDDPGDDGADEPVATVASTTSTTILIGGRADATTTTSAPLPPLSDRFDRVEVSARIVSNGDERVVSIVADETSLAAVDDTADPRRAAAWCSGVAGAATGSAPDAPFVVRVDADAAGETTGGVLTFDLVSDGPLAPGATDLAAGLVIGLDDTTLTVPGASVVVAADPSTGTFGGETADGVVVEGAYRCA